MGTYLDTFPEAAPPLSLEEVVEVQLAASHTQSHAEAAKRAEAEGKDKAAGGAVAGAGRGGAVRWGGGAVGSGGCRGGGSGLLLGWLALQSLC